jgi:hypothetical protein
MPVHATTPDATPSAPGPGASQRTLKGPVIAFATARVINPAMRRLLGSRFHGPLGSSTLMVLEFQGRTTGRAYRFPIGYMQTGRELVCYTPFRWWTNLRGGAPVTVSLRGRRLRGTADVVTDPAAVATGMDAYLRHNPGDAMFWKVRLDRDKVPDPADIERVSHQNAQILITLAEDE